MPLYTTDSLAALFSPCLLSVDLFWFSHPGRDIPGHLPSRVPHRRRKLIHTPYTRVIRGMACSNTRRMRSNNSLKHQLHSHPSINLFPLRALYRTTHVRLTVICSPLILQQPHVSNHEPDEPDNVQRIPHVARQVIDRLVSVFLPLTLHPPSHLRKVSREPQHNTHKTCQTGEAAGKMQLDLEVLLCLSCKPSTTKGKTRCMLLFFICCFSCDTPRALLRLIYSSQDLMMRFDSAVLNHTTCGCSHSSSLKTASVGLGCLNQHAYFVKLNS